MISQRDQSSLMTFAISGLEPRDVVARLREQYVFTRTIVVTEPRGVRLSIGVWNRESDLERIAEMMRALARRA